MEISIEKQVLAGLHLIPVQETDPQTDSPYNLTLILNRENTAVEVLKQNVYHYMIYLILWYKYNPVVELLQESFNIFQ